MSYMITFVFCEPGMTAGQTLEWINSTWNGVVEEPPLRLSQDQAAAWQRVVAETQARFGPAEPDVFEGHLELSWAKPRIRLEYSGTAAAIMVPYWYRGSAAENAIERAYGIGRIVQAITGLEAIDAQTGSGLTPEDLTHAVRTYAATSEDAASLRETD